MVNDQEFQPHRELPLETQNQLIAGQVQWSIDQAAQQGHVIFGGNAANFIGRDNRDLEVHLRKHQGRIVGLSEIAYPVYEVSIWHQRADMTRATAFQGRFDEYFKDPQGNLYSAVNVYYFNLNGQAVKSEEVNQFPVSAQNFLEEELRRRGLHSEELREVDSPKIGVSFVPLEPGDYEKVLSILGQIKKGELVTD